MECEQCKATFTKTENLNRHKLSHSHKNKFSCDLCDVSFARPDYLSKHLNSKKHANKKNPPIPPPPPPLPYPGQQNVDDDTENCENDCYESAFNNHLLTKKIIPSKIEAQDVILSLAAYKVIKKI